VAGARVRASLKTHKGRIPRHRLARHAYILTSDTRDLPPKLFLRQAERGSRPTRRHTREDRREDAGEDVGVGVVECGLN